MIKNDNFSNNSNRVINRNSLDQIINDVFGSMSRKNIIKRSPMYPDAKHMHQLIFFYINKKYNLSTFLANTLTAQMINIYNLIIFLIGLNFITNSKIQIFLILLSVSMYSLAYIKLFKFKYQKSV